MIVNLTSKYGLGLSGIYLNVVFLHANPSVVTHFCFIKIPLHALDIQVINRSHVVPNRFLLGVLVRIPLLILKCSWVDRKFA